MHQTWVGSPGECLRLSRTRPRWRLDRYLRARERHRDTDAPWLWLGQRGQPTRWGVGQMLERRAAQAGIPNLHPHQPRQTFCHEWLAQGGSETDLMRLAGWKSRVVAGWNSAGLELSG
jgi:site-specific recombinase XerD